MAIVTIESQIDTLRHRIGDTQEGSFIYLDNADGSVNDLYTYMALAVGDFNEESSPAYDIQGTGKSRYYNPEPSDTDKKLLCLYAAKRIVRNEWIRAGRVAISFGNAAGRENLIDVAKALKMVLDDITDEIIALLPGYETIKDFGGGKSSFSDKTNKTTYGTVYCDCCSRLITDCTCRN